MNPEDRKSMFRLGTISQKKTWNIIKNRRLDIPGAGQDGTVKGGFVSMIAAKEEVFYKDSSILVSMLSGHSKEVSCIIESKTHQVL
jgi:hypothetical protein